VDDPTAHAEPLIPELQQWDDERKKVIKQQTALADAKEAREVALTGRSMTEAAVQKRKEREEKKARKLAFAAEMATSGTSPDPISTPPPIDALPKGHERSDTPTPSVRDSGHVHPHTVVVPTTSASFEWYKPDGNTYSTIASAKTARIWNYPATLHERARCGVFKSLWEQGYFMGSGIKFGGDYLVYPGESVMASI
jgi:tRNA-splicing endonuclease subunit Sen34